MPPCPTCCDFHDLADEKSRLMLAGDSGIEPALNIFLPQAAS